MSRWSSIASRAAGKWQLPALGLSLVALPLSVALLRPNPLTMPLDKAEQTLETLNETGAYDYARQLGSAILERKDCTGPVAAPFHLHLARAHYGAAVAEGRRTANASKTVVHHFRQAAANGAMPTADDLVSLGHALDWGGQYNLALESYEQALQNGYRHAGELRKRIIVLQRDELGATPETLDALVDELMSMTGPARPESDSSVSIDNSELFMWAVEEKLFLLDDLGRLHEADELLTEFSRQIDDSSGEAGFKGANAPAAFHFDYLRAWVLYHTGAYTEAEAALRVLRNRLEPEDPLSAKAGWLLGRVVLFDDGPQRPMEAISFFRNVLAHHATGLYAVACRLGAAEALAYMRQDREAIDQYRAAIAELPALERGRVINRGAVRASLMIQAERHRQGGHLAAALGYAELAAGLVDSSRTEQAVAHFQQLAMVQSQYAQELRRQAADSHLPHDPAAYPDSPTKFERIQAEVTPDWREMFVAAARTYKRLAELDVHNERRSTEAAWLSAEMIGRAGRRQKAIELYEQFVRERPQNALVPRALLRIGQLHQSAGRFAEAVQSYQACYRQFPKTLDGIRTLVPMAHAYVAMGPENLELAEKTLRIVLEESDVFTPEAPEFGDALFLQGDVLARRGEFERAIAVLHEAIDRYPSDSRVWRARYLVADCYRQSALALTREASEARFEGEIDQIRTESQARFASARSLYRELIDEYDARGVSRLSELERTYLRHSHLYEADCLFESQEYREAARLYEDAAGMFKDIPASLSAYVQMIHCHVFLGEPRQARTALARARVVLDRMDPEAFTASVSPESKSDWAQYFNWLADAELF